MFMLFAQVEPGHACPVSMTHAAVASIEGSPWIADEWLPRLYSRDYEPRLLPNEQKRSALIGMAMTEKQGGSDVRAGTTVGTSMGGHAYQLTGHKWFCSAPMSDGFLVLAHTRRGAEDEGLSCLFVPRLLPHGMRNVFRIQRLKDKLGNRSNASAEVEFDGTVGFVLGEPGRGVAHDHRDGPAHPPRLRARHGSGNAAVRRRGALARARPRGVRRTARGPARDDVGARGPRARVRSGDAHRPAARAAVRGRCLGSGCRAAPARDARLEVLGDQARSASRLRGARVPRAATATPSRSRSRGVTGSSR